MLCNHLFRITIILLCNVFISINSLSSSPKTTAAFYQATNKEGYKIAYRDDPVSWSDLKNVFDLKEIHSDSYPELLCVSGIWLSYEHPLYKASNTETVYLISGNDNCISPSDLGTVGSMQALTNTAAKPEDSISLFSSSNFGSLAQTFRAKESERGGLKQLDEDAQQIGSLIVVGEKPWSLISSHKKIICVRPQAGGGSDSICYGKDEILIEDFYVNANYPNCPDEDDPSVVYNHKLTDCKQFGSSKPEPLNTNIMMGRSMGGAMECKYNITWNSTKFSEEESALIAKLLTIRLTHDFDNPEQILWPDSTEDIWKTGPLDTAFDIMIATVPTEIVNVQLLKMVREFTVYHLNEVWNEQRENNENAKAKDWRSHKVLAHMLDVHMSYTCYRNKRTICRGKIIKSAYNQRSNLKDFNDKIDPDFELDSDNDPIIEMAYVISNYAMALCHNLFEYKINFWDNFVTTFGQLYFGPLQTRWKLPKIPSPKTFGIILSGYGIENQHRRIAFATTRMFELTPKFEPFEKNLTVNVITSTM